MAKRAVIIDILSDAKSFVKGSKDAEAAAGSLESKTQQLGRTLVSAYAAKRIVDFGQAAVKAAMEDAAGQRVLATALANTTGATDEQIASVEDWIDATQRALGVADTELRPALSTLAASTKDVAEAQDLLGLALDTSRAKGIPLEVVAKAIAKAHDGNTAALTKLVPGLKESGEKTLDFATAMQRLNGQVAGQAEAWAQTDEGKLARMNVAWDEMQETLGTALLPVMGQLIGIVSTVFDWFNSLDETTQQFIVTATLVGGALYVGVTAANAMKVAVQGLGLTVGKAGPVLLGLSIAVAAISAAVAFFGDGEAEAAARADDFYASVLTGIATIDAQADAFDNATDKAKAYADAAYGDAEAKLRETILGNRDLVAAMLRVGLTIDEVVASTRGGAAAQAALAAVQANGTRVAGTYAEAQQENADITFQQWSALRMQQTAEEELAATIANQSQAQYDSTQIAIERMKVGDAQAAQWLLATGQLDAVTASSRAQSLAWREMAETGTAAADATADVGGDAITTGAAVLELADATGELKRAFDEIIGPSMNLEQSQRRLLDAAQATADAIADNGETLDINTEAGRKNRDAVQAQAEAMLGQADAMIRSGSTTAEATAFALAYRDELGAQLTALGLNQTEVDDYLTTLGLTPENVTTSLDLANKEVVAKQLTDVLKQLEGVDAGAVADIQAMIDEGDFTAAAAAINNLPGSHTTLIGVKSDGSSVTLTTEGGGGGARVSYRAAGGPVEAGQPYVVGEKRPELFVPNVDGWILPKVPREFVGAAAGPSGGGGGGPLFRDLIVRDDRSINDELELVMALQGFRP